jgi:hypothetical protein
MKHLFILITHLGIVPEVIGPYPTEESRNETLEWLPNSSEHRRLMKFTYTKLDVIDGKPSLRD